MISSLSGKAFKRYGRYEKTIRRWFLSGNTVTFVALHSNKKGGFIMVGPIDIYQTAKNYPEVLAIAVKPQFQGMGIGRELLLKAEEELKDKVHSLEIFQKASVDRELKMVELKEYVNKLESRIKECIFIPLWIISGHRGCFRGWGIGS